MKAYWEGTSLVFVSETEDDKQLLEGWYSRSKIAEEVLKIATKEIIETFRSELEKKEK